MLQKGVTSYKVAKTITAKNSKINKFTKLISQKLFIILCKKFKKKKKWAKFFSSQICFALLLTNLLGFIKETCWINHRLSHILNHVLLISNIQRQIHFVNASIASTRSEKLLGITLDSELKFEEHINKICNIVNKKLNALHRIGSHMSLDKRKMLLRAFIESQFSYCPLIWMFHSRTLNNKIKRLHEKALRIVCGDYKSKFDELLEKGSSLNIQTLAIEIFKYLNRLSPQIMNEVFQVKSPAPYYLRDKNELFSRNPKTVAYGTESVSFMVPKIWSLVPQELKNPQSLYSFKKSIRKWKPNCPSRLCKTYL